MALLYINNKCDPIRMTLNNNSQKLKSMFVQSLIKKGKKHKAENLLFKVSQKLLHDNCQILSPTLLHAVKNTKPLVTFKKIRLKGSSYTVPLFLENPKQLKTALNWLRFAALGSKRSFIDRLTKELLSSLSNQGPLTLQRKESHQKANQNKVFAHYRWF